MLFVRAFRCVITASIFLFAAGASAQTPITIGGTGSSGPLVEKLFDDFRKRVPDVVLKVISPPLGTGGGIKAAQVGKVDVAVIGRDLTDEERRHVADTFLLADTPLVLASSQPKGSIGIDELVAIYSGRTVKWTSGESIRLVLRAKTDGDTNAMRSLSQAMDTAINQALVRPGMFVANDDIEAVDVLVRTHGALGPTNLALIKALGVHLWPIALNGIAPSVSALRSGAYPLRKSFYVVIAHSASPTAKRFVEYLKSSEADIVLHRFDCIRPGR